MMFMEDNGSCNSVKKTSEYFQEDDDVHGR